MLRGHIFQWWVIGRIYTSHPLGIQLFARCWCMGGRRLEGMELN